MKDLKGLKVNFLGDSITEGCGASCKEARFVDVFAAKTGATVRNYGIGGTRIARQLQPSPKPVYDRYFGGRVDGMEQDADLIVVFGGTNDFGHGDAPLGVMSDRTADTFYGALHVLYSSLLEKYPAAEIVVLTPLHRFNESDPAKNPRRTPPLLLRPFVDAIREVAEYYALPVLDLYAASGLQPCVPTIMERYVPDGLHPNDAGHEILARRIGAFLSAL